MKLSLLILIALLASCAKRSQDTEQAVVELGSINQDIEVLAPDDTPKTGGEPSLAVIKNSTSQITLFTKTICSSLSNGALDSTNNDELFSEQAKAIWEKYTSFFAQYKFTCKSQENQLEAFPNDVTRMNFEEEGIVIILTSIFNQAGKIDSFHLLATSSVVEFKKHRVTVGPEIELGTYSFNVAGDKRPVIFYKSPYLAKNFIYFTRTAEKYVRMGFNFVFQSNRGSYESDGDFKWLHIENVADQEKTLEWISKQDFYTNGVIAMGGSYDGFNALTAAITDSPYLKATIACSAPANARTDSFTANEVVELAYMSYFDTVKSGFSKASLSQDIWSAIKSGVALKDIDNQLIGRNETDWDEALELKNEDSEYFAKRDLLPALANVEKPVLIIGGFNNDQDGRDSLLSYEALKANPAISGYFHQYGHGCGKFEEGPVFMELLKNVFENTDLAAFKKLTISYANDLEISNDTGVFPMETSHLAFEAYQPVTNPNEPKGISFMQDYIYGLETQERTFFVSSEVIEVETKLYGSMELTAMVKSYIPFNAVNLAITVLTKDNKVQQLALMVSNTINSRSQFLVKEPLIDTQMKIITTPVVATIPAGARIILEVSSANIASFPLRRVARQEFVSINNTSSMGLSFLNTPGLKLSKEPSVVQ
jgi:hypothetical protein